MPTTRAGPCSSRAHRHVWCSALRENFGFFSAKPLENQLFFPVGNTGAAYQQIEEAKAVCRTCKVIDACLKCALDTNQDYGVWGGLSEDERRALKRRAMRARRSQAMQMQI